MVLDKLSTEYLFTTTLPSRVAKCAPCTIKIRPIHLIWNAALLLRSAIDTPNKALWNYYPQSHVQRPQTLYFFTCIHSSYFCLRSLRSDTSPDKLSPFFCSRVWYATTNVIGSKIYFVIAAVRSSTHWNICIFGYSDAGPQPTAQLPSNPTIWKEKYNTIYKMYA